MGRKRIEIIFLKGVLILSCLVGFSALSFAFENINYKINCSFDPKSNCLTCQEVISFQPNIKLNEIHLHFYPHHIWDKKDIENYKRYAKYFSIDDPFLGDFEQNEAGISYVSVNSHPVSFAWRSQDRTILVLKTGQIVAETITIRINFWLKVPKRIGRFGRAKGLYSLYRFYPMLCVYRNGKFLDYPDLLLHQPYISEVANYKVRLSIPKLFKAAGTGICSVTEKGDKKIYLFQTDFPVRDFYLAFSKYYRVYQDRYGKTNIKVLFLGDREEKAKEIAEYIKDAIRFYSKKLFPYPYKSISVIPIFLGYGGNESSNVVMLDWRVYDLPIILRRYKEFLVVHELGHQWWFNLIGSDEYKQTWMDEGINSFFVHSYLKEKYGADPNILFLPGVLKFLVPNVSFESSSIFKWRYLVQRGISSSVIGEIGNFKEPSLIFAVAYGKGFWALKILSKIYGDNRLFKVFRDYANRFKFKLGYLRDFRSLVRSEMGKGAVAVLDYYLSDKKVDLSWKKEGRKLKIKVKGQMPPQGFWIEYKKNNKLEKQMVYFPDQIVLEGVSFARLDVDDRILETDEDNNVYPSIKGIDLEIVPINHQLYDFDVVNKKEVFRIGSFFSKYGLGLRGSWISPSVGFKSWIAFQHKIGEDLRAVILSMEKQAPFSLWANCGIKYVYQDSNDNDILHRKLLSYIRFDLAPIGANPFKVNDNLEFYFASEWQKIADLLYYSESDFSYLGMSLLKHWQDFRIFLAVEKAVKLLNSDENFWRFFIKAEDTFKVKQTKIIIRTAVGLSDENNRRKPIFYLGDQQGLRAYSNYSLPTANEVVLSCDWLLPIWQRNVYDGALGWIDVDGVDFVTFFDFGKAWGQSFADADCYKDIGIGICLDLRVGANLSNIKMRIDFAKDLDDNKSSKVNLYFRF